MLWGAFAVRLGDKTFAEHVDTISETPEAKQLIDDTRSTINPALVEVRDRLLGEYVEAPTWIADQPGDDDQSSELVSEPDAGARSGGEPSLPGRPAAQLARGLEPPLPGHR